MKLLVRLLVILLILAGLLGPGREYSAYAVWWVTNSQPPLVELAGPPGPVRGAVQVPVQTTPPGRVELVTADFDGRPLEVGPILRVDTTGLSDGEHTLSVRVEDRSWRRNTASASVRVRSDNTPPRFEVQTSPSTVAQGHSVVVFVRPSEPSEVQANLAGTPLPLYPAGNDFWAVAGIEAGEAPGRREITIEGQDRVGNRGQGRGEVNLKEFEFTRFALEVPQAMLPLLAAGIRTEEDERLKAIYQPVSGPPLWKGAFRLPVRGPVSTEFGEIRSYNGQPFAGHHNGTDFQVGAGTPVQAPARGRVVDRGEVKLRGRVLVLDHGGGVYTTYAHLEDWLVDVGQEVQPGQPIAKVGTTGLSTGPHLHWELWVGGRAVDPVEWTEREIP